MPPVKFVLLAMSAALVVMAPAMAEVPDGRFLFNKRCATCHQAEALMPRLMKLPDDKERQAYLNKFLARHHARDAEERALIVDYLLKHQPR
jgi:hypothetical protein